MVGRLWVGGIVAGLLVLHLLASYAEAKGWICYRQGSGRGTSAAISNALAEFEAIIDPAAEHPSGRGAFPEGHPLRSHLRAAGRRRGRTADEQRRGSRRAIGGLRSVG